ncbi:MAG: tetraacyldisaccharide 4'-kinase [Pseudomonadota bacterium]
MYNFILRLWYQKPRFHPITCLLLPFAAIFWLIIQVRRICYKIGIKKVTHFSVPIIVVGNITVGGTGKTPLVIRLVELMQSKGYQVGVVSRGYGVKPIREPMVVRFESDVLSVGDEAMVIGNHVDAPIVVCCSRIKAIEKLIHDFQCDVIISDDGLQHYAMARDIEIVVVDMERQFGNGFLLPAGPLREPISRLGSVDVVVHHGLDMCLKNDDAWYGVLDNTQRKDVKQFQGQIIHAITGIGHPERFFRQLRALGLTIIEHVFPDHYLFTLEDIDVGKNEIVVMTEKDAVKCHSFADNRHWFIKTHAVLDSAVEQQLCDQLARINSK